MELYTEAASMLAPYKETSVNKQIKYQGIIAWYADYEDKISNSHESCKSEYLE